MPDDHTMSEAEFKEAEAKLEALGDRLRATWKKQHPTPEKSLDTVRTSVREQWEKEQKAEREKSLNQSPAKSQERERKGPDRG